MANTKLARNNGTLTDLQIRTYPSGGTQKPIAEFKLVARRKDGTVAFTVPCVTFRQATIDALKAFGQGAAISIAGERKMVTVDGGKYKEQGMVVAFVDDNSDEAIQARVDAKNGASTASDDTAADVPAETTDEEIPF